MKIRKITSKRGREKRHIVFGEFYVHCTQKGVLGPFFRQNDKVRHFAYVRTFLQQLLLPQQLEKILAGIAASDCEGDGGGEPEEACVVKRLGAPLKGRSISTNSRS